MLDPLALPAALAPWCVPGGHWAQLALARALEQSLQRSGAQPPTHEWLARLAEQGATFRAWGDRIAQQRQYAVDGARDAEVAGLWERWLAGDLRAVWMPWEDRFLPVAERVFRARLDAAGQPRSVIEHEVRELRRSFIFKMVGKEGGVLGWRELLARVIETGPQGPIAALIPTLADDDWPAMALALARGATTHRTVGVWLGGIAGAEVRASLLARQLAEDPRRLLQVLELHLLLQAAENNVDGDSGAGAMLMRLRWATGRLRAVVTLRAHDTALRRGLDLARPGLAARTEAAVGRYAWSWAMDELKRAGYLADPCVRAELDVVAGASPRHARSGCPWDTGRAVTRPCELHDPPLQGLDPCHERRVSAWLCLFVLRLGVERLEQWARTRDSANHLSRLGDLQSLLPADLTEHVPGSNRRYERLRATLLGAPLARLIGAWRPVFEEIASWPVRDRQNPARLRTLLLPGWPPDLDLPKRGVPRMIAHAAHALVWLRTQEEPV